MERIDDAVARVLRLKYRLGLFDHPYWDIKKYDKFGSKGICSCCPAGCRGIGSVAKE